MPSSSLSDIVAVQWCHDCNGQQKNNKMAFLTITIWTSEQEQDINKNRICSDPHLQQTGGIEIVNRVEPLFVCGTVCVDALRKINQCCDLHNLFQLSLNTNWMDKQRERKSSDAVMLWCCGCFWHSAFCSKLLILKFNDKTQATSKEQTTLNRLWHSWIKCARSTRVHYPHHPKMQWHASARSTRVHYPHHPKMRWLASARSTRVHYPHHLKMLFIASARSTLVQHQHQPMMHWHACASLTREQDHHRPKMPFLALSGSTLVHAQLQAAAFRSLSSFRCCEKHSSFIFSTRPCTKQERQSVTSPKQQAKNETLASVWVFIVFCLCCMVQVSYGEMEKHWCSRKCDACTG